MLSLGDSYGINYFVIFLGWIGFATSVFTSIYGFVSLLCLGPVVTGDNARLGEVWGRMV